MKIVEKIQSYKNCLFYVRANVMCVIVVENNKSKAIQEVKNTVELVVNTQSQKCFVVNVVIRYYDKANDITRRWLLLSLFLFFKPKIIS